MTINWRKFLGTHPEASVDDVSLPLTRDVDEHMFQLELGYSRSTARLQVLTGPGTPVVVASQILGKEHGGSVSNLAEQFTFEAWRRFLPDTKHAPILVIHYVDEAESWDRSLVATFAQTPDGKLTDPQWGAVPEHLLQGLQAAAELGRGSGFTPLLPPPPTDIQVWVEFQSKKLPRTRPFRTECMKGARNKRAIGSTCCWYHQQHWSNAVASAVESVRDGSSSRGIESPRLDQAAASLIYDPVQRGRTARGYSYVNGQHRCQAIIDQGAPTILALIYRKTSAPRLPGEIALFDDED